jgi:hypothetical protein
MKNNITNNVVSIVYTPTGEVLDAELNLKLSKRYLPKCFTTFVKDRKKLRGLPGYAREVLDEMCSQMTKGNRLFISEEALAIDCEKHRGTIHRALRQLKHRDVVRGTHGVYMVNPLYALNGGSAYLVQAHNDYQMMPKGGK